jgi:hypothetical protein
MKKVFADKELKYSENEKFDIPEEYENPCASRSKGNDSNGARQSGFDDLFN